MRLLPDTGNPTAVGRNERPGEEVEVGGTIDPGFETAAIAARVARPPWGPSAATWMLPHATGEASRPAVADDVNAAVGTPDIDGLTSATGYVGGLGPHRSRVRARKSNLRGGRERDTNRDRPQSGPKQDDVRIPDHGEPYNERPLRQVGLGSLPILMACQRESPTWR